MPKNLIPINYFIYLGVHIESQLNFQVLVKPLNKEFQDPLALFQHQNILCQPLFALWAIIAIFANVKTFMSLLNGVLSKLMYLKRISKWLGGHAPPTKQFVIFRHKKRHFSTI